MDRVDVVTAGAIDRLQRELERLRAENARLSRLLGLRGHDTAPAPEQLAVPAPALATMASPVQDTLALYADRFPGRMRRAMGGGARAEGRAQTIQGIDGR